VRICCWRKALAQAAYSCLHIPTTPPPLAGKRKEVLCPKEADISGDLSFDGDI